MEALSAYEVADERPGEDYWRVRDYYNAAAHPSSNYNVRKVLAYEGVEQEVIKALLTEALESDKDLTELAHESLETTLRKCSDIRDVLESDAEPTDQAQQLAARMEVDDAARLASDLEQWPTKKNGDSETESPRLRPEGGDQRSRVGLPPVEPW